MPEIREQEEKSWNPRYLKPEERGLTRKLYHAVFAEDTERFIDYYYQYKIRDNEILVLEEEGKIISMLHLNPYTMIVNGYEFPCNYIVAVATDPDYRHQGCMRALLERALNDMADRKMPFTFLMPASESIYAPFDFVWICPFTELPMRVARMNADGQNRYLASHYQMFCKRTQNYMENLAAEKKAEEGEAASDKMPPFMVRITDVCGMLSLACGRQEQELYLQIKDPIIGKNNGYFQWKISGEQSTAVKLSEKPEHVDLELTVGELASMIFEGFHICLTEVV